MSRGHFDDRGAAYDRAVDAQLCAYNTAFAELGLRFRWDARTLASLATIEGEQARIMAYIEANHAHLLKAYSGEFLSGAILAKKSAYLPDVLPTRAPPVVDASRAQRASLEYSVTSDLADEHGLPALAGA